MLRRDQDIIDQFNADELRYRQRQLRKRKRRLRFPELGELRHLILNLLDEMGERRRSADCIGRRWLGRRL